MGVTFISKRIAYIPRLNPDLRDFTNSLSFMVLLFAVIIFLIQKMQGDCISNPPAFLEVRRLVVVDGRVPVGVVVGGVVGTASRMATIGSVASAVSTTMRVVIRAASATTTASASSTRKSLVDNFHFFHLLPLLFITKTAVKFYFRLLIQPLVRCTRFRKCVECIRIGFQNVIVHTEAHPQLLADSFASFCLFFHV